MSGDRRPGGGPDPTEDDVVVPHPFGTGSPDQPSEAEAAEVEPVEAAVPDADTGDAAATVAEPAADVDAPVATADDPATENEPAPGNDVTTEDRRATGEEQDPPAAGQRTGRRTRDPLAAALIGVLTLLLGFAFAVQVRAVGDDQEYAGAREEDLVRILDELNAREARLRDQIADQRTALQQLNSSDSQSTTALEEARARAEAIGILNGTVAAQGPGLVMTIRDADDKVRVSDILDAIQELRGAGAETMQIDGVRVGVSTAVTGTPGSLMVDGRPITSPYEFVVIGSPQNMETALNIPGGVVQDLTRHGASVMITQSEQVTVDALRPLDTPQYASPDTGG
jgi:uncharacterized protein YlxW (UPF0749 family)